MSCVRAIVSSPCIDGRYGRYAVCRFMNCGQITNATFSLDEAWTESRHPLVGEEVIASEPVMKAAGWRFLHVRPLRLTDAQNL
jgi:hypothetical protein